MNRGLSPVIIGLFVSAIAAIFALSLLLSGATDEPVGPGVASKSAIGHAGLYETLSRLGLPMQQSRANSTRNPTDGGVLVLAEPETRYLDAEDELGLDRADNILIILPKWRGTMDETHPGFVGRVERMSIGAVHAILELVTTKAILARVAPPASWTINKIGIIPKIGNQVQLVKGPDLHPLIGNADGMLLAEVQSASQRIWILADPDPLENHGLTEGDNAGFAYALVTKLRGGDGTIVFDEAMHGAKAPNRNLARILFEFPYVVVTFQILVALGLLLLATTSRFGGMETEPPPFDHGKRGLIGNMAALLDRAGHHAVVFRRYVSVSLRDAGQELHAPPGLDDPALAVWLARFGRTRGVTIDPAEILARSESTDQSRKPTVSTLFDVARDIHRWKEALLHGSGSRQGRH